MRSLLLIKAARKYVQVAPETQSAPDSMDLQVYEYFTQPAPLDWTHKFTRTGDP